MGHEIERVCVDNELVIQTWSPIHLRAKLQAFYWKEDRPSIKAIEDAPFLTQKQKRDILYNNAARFLRLSKEEIARHHAM